VSSALSRIGGRSGWGAVVGRTIALQWAVILILAIAAWIWAAEAGAVSLLVGGAAVAVPNALLALWLTIRIQRVGTLATTALLVGELLKLGLTLALLAILVAAYRHAMVWPAFIVGVVGALKAQWLALWYTRNA
jgi:ATP synthase protein I